MGCRGYTAKLGKSHLVPSCNTVIQPYHVRQTLNPSGKLPENLQIRETLGETPVRLVRHLENPRDTNTFVRPVRHWEDSRERTQFLYILAIKADYGKQWANYEYG